LKSGPCYTRTLDYLKREGINTLLVNLTPGSGTDEETETAVSSIVDTWVIICFERTYGRRQRQIYVHKARGIGHSHDLGELILSDTGVTVKPIVFQKKRREVNHVHRDDPKGSSMPKYTGNMGAAPVCDG
jgi:hypothetical protein